MSFFRANSLLSSLSRLSIASAPQRAAAAAPTPSTSALFQPRQLLQVRNKSLVPRRTKYRKAHKGRTPLALGGSTKGSTLEWGDYGLRVNEAVRLSAKHLEVAEAALKRGLKPVRGSKVSVLSPSARATRSLTHCHRSGTCASSPTSPSASRYVAAPPGALIKRDALTSTALTGKRDAHGQGQGDVRVLGVQVRRCYSFLDERVN